MAKVTVPLNSFFRTQSVQKSYKFIVDFVINGVNGNHQSVMEDTTKGSDSVLNVFGAEKDFPIKSYHVKNVVLPTTAFKKEVHKLGSFSKTYPILDFEGFELKVELVEDEKHNLGNFITYLSKRIVAADGVYYAPSKQFISSINITVMKSSNEAVATYRFRNSYYLNATEPSYNYESNEGVSQVLTFVANHMEVDYHENSNESTTPDSKGNSSDSISINSII